MDNLDELYNDLIMEHSMNSYNKKNLEEADYCRMGHNPNCGDEIEIQVKLNGDIIEDMSFTGHGCAISQASTSIMIDVLKGKTIKEAKDIIQTWNGKTIIFTPLNAKIMGKDTIIPNILDHKYKVLTYIGEFSFFQV